MMPLWTTTMLPVQSAVRVRVLLGRTSVRRPPRVAHAVEAVHRILANRVLEVHQFAGRPAEADALGADERHARRVVAAVLHAPEAVDEDRHDGFGADVSDDSAHMGIPFVC
jgi:hypothetical protein